MFYYDMKESIYVLKLIPGMKADILTYIFENYDAIVIESFGVGGLPETCLLYTSRRWCVRGEQ